MIVPKHMLRKASFALDGESIVKIGNQQYFLHLKGHQVVINIAIGIVFIQESLK